MGRRGFLSFAYEDESQVRGFLLLKWNRYVGLDFVGRHLLERVNSENEAYIRSRIRELMDGTSVMVVLIGGTTAQSLWVDWEIREALARGKGILGIYLKGAEGAPIPPALLEAGARVIPWDTALFEDEIETAALIAGRPRLGPPTEAASSAGICPR